MTHTDGKRKMTDQGGGNTDMFVILLKYMIACVYI